ncbi:MAG: GntR family transcriptional regulator [Clostridiales bacterium]|nr:GntR family transcriptional regulator [Clostridiales bacterium]
MEKNVDLSNPIYQQIALDIASKIISGHYEIGDKLYARSVLASQYGVSPETARRAVSILSDVGIVEVTKGSGVIIKSSENALKYVRQYTDIQTMKDLKRDIIGSIERQNKENDNLKEMIGILMDKTERFKASNPFIPYEILIDEKCKYLGKTISDINFWHHTSATIVAIKRNNELLLSPGPYAVLTKGDFIYFVGDENSPERVYKYLFH